LLEENSRARYPPAVFPARIGVAGKKLQEYVMTFAQWDASFNEAIGSIERELSPRIKRPEDE